MTDTGISAETEFCVEVHLFYVTEDAEAEALSFFRENKIKIIPPTVNPKLPASVRVWYLGRIRFGSKRDRQ
jgi:hypothetical protein